MFILKAVSGTGNLGFVLSVMWRLRARGGDTPGVLYGCEYKGFAGGGICKSLKRKGERGGAMDGHGADGVRAGEVKRKDERCMLANVVVEDSRRGTRGQLVGGTVEGQVAGF